MYKKGRHHILTVSWQMSMPRSNSRSSTFRSDSGKRMRAANGGTIEEARQLVLGGLGGIPIRRAAEPHEVADLIAYLASDRAAGRQS
jgi:NAD(P)-dependent dehydrogenase (short-subunit alcohol dehydrogenase family)